MRADGRNFAPPAIQMGTWGDREQQQQHGHVSSSSRGINGGRGGGNEQEDTGIPDQVIKIDFILAVNTTF